MATIPEELCDWLGARVTGVFATVNADMRPTLYRVWAVRPTDDHTAIDLTIAASEAHRCWRDVQAQPIVAANLVSPETYRSIQFKGRAEPHEGPTDRAFLRAYLDTLDECFASVGLPENSTNNMFGVYGSLSKVAMLRLHVDDIYDQSPKKGTGARFVATSS